jgi:hypothetical protein
MYNILPILAMFKFMDEKKNKLNIKKKFGELFTLISQVNPKSFNAQ